MLSLSAALIRRLLPGLSEDTPRTQGLRTWIGTGSFIVVGSAIHGDIFLRNVTMTELMPFFSFDYERFALSSLESFLCCPPKTGTPKAIGWSIIKLYYAAFYGAHAVMRGTGRAVFRVDKSQATRVTQVASLYDSAI